MKQLGPPTAIRLLALAAAACALWPLVAAGADRQTQRRTIDSADLLRIADIGVTSEQDGEGLALSPDHTLAALEVRRAVPETNSVTIQWIIVSLNRPLAITDVGDGGSPISDFYLGSSSGYSPPQRPEWSPDSRWIAYRMGHGADVQLWRSDRDGKRREKLTSSETAVQRFRWSQDGKRILFQVSAAGNESLRLEGKQGYLYDERFAPVETLKPIDPSEAAFALRAYDVATRADRSASPEEHAEFEQLEANALLPSLVRRAAGVSAWIEDLRADRSMGVDPARTVVARAGDAPPVTCRNPACTTPFFKGLWLSDDGRTVYFLRWTGARAHGAMSLYGWRWASDEVAEILRTDDLIEGCAQAGRQLICARESATSPRKVVSIELATGAVATVFDPNPHFSTFAFGSVTSEHWHDRDGIPGFGHR